MKSKGERVAQPVKLPINIRRKLERMAQAQYSDMNAVIVKLIADAPEPRKVSKAIQE